MHISAAGFRNVCFVGNCAQISSWLSMLVAMHSRMSVFRV